jgi:probable F420-dependent oxidoreductase
MSFPPGGTGIWSMGLRFGEEEPSVELTKAVEDLGYTAVWFPDMGGGGLFERVTALLDATSQITVATGICNIWMHEPAEVAEQYNKLTAAYGPRLLLGLGASHAPIVDQIEQGRYRKPLSKMRSFLDELDAISPGVPVESRLLAALGPKMMELAGTRSAGAHPYLVPPEHTAAAREALGPDAYLAVEVGVVLEADPDAARQIARAGLEMYFGLPNYLNNLRNHGLDDEDLSHPGSDKLIDSVIAWGDDKAIAARLDEYRSAGADHIAIQVLTGAGTADPTFPIDQLRQLAPALLH